MKSILTFFLLAFCCLLSQSCTVAGGDSQKGTYHYASLGGNASGYQQTPQGMAAATIDNAGSFREINKSARFGLGVSGALGLAKDLSAAWTSTQNASTAATVSKAAGAEATSQAAIAADVNKAKLAAEAAAVPVPVP